MTPFLKQLRILFVSIPAATILMILLLPFEMVKALCKTIFEILSMYTNYLSLTLGPLTEVDRGKGGGVLDEDILAALQPLGVGKAN